MSPGQCFYLIGLHNPLLIVSVQGYLMLINRVKLMLLILKQYLLSIPAGIYLLKVNNKNIRTMCEICSKLTIKIPERHHWGRSGIFIVNFEHISDVALVFLLLTLRR